MSEQNTVTAKRLKSFIERIERLEEEKAAIAADIKEVYSEAKGTGFDTKTMREIIRLRKMSEQERAERESLLDIYKAALGMLADTPLGAAALRRLAKKRKRKTIRKTTTKQCHLKKLSLPPIHIRIKVSKMPAIWAQRRRRKESP